MKEIEELWFENKELKREIWKLLFFVVEEEFFLKIIKFIDWFVKEIKEWEVKMYVLCGVFYLEKYGLDGDYSNWVFMDLS